MFTTLKYRLFCNGKMSHGFHKWSLWKRGVVAWKDVYRCEKCKRRQHTWG